MAKTNPPPTPATPRPDAPLDVAALPAYWDARRAKDGKPDKSTCAAELRRALEAVTPAPDDAAIRSLMEAAFRAGYDWAEERAEISEHNGYHRIDPAIEWPTYEQRDNAITAYVASVDVSALRRLDAEAAYRARVQALCVALDRQASHREHGVGYEFANVDALNIDGARKALLAEHPERSGAGGE